MVEDRLPAVDRRPVDEVARFHVQWIEGAAQNMRERIDRAIAGGKPGDLVAVLRGASAAEIRYAGRQFARLRDGDELSSERLAAFARSEEPSARQLACYLVPKVYTDSPDDAATVLELLFEDDDWTIRDAAAAVAGALLRKDFRSMLERVRVWRDAPSVSARRAAVIAAARAAHPHHLERAEPLLKLLQPLLEERDPLLRRALGPSALGSSLLRHYPRTTFEYLTQWSTSNNPQVLWNVSMAFSTPPAASMAKKALIILRKLSLDPRRFVWRAVASAVWKLGRKCPDIVRPELARWLEDERRIDVAREALKHL